jgi:hypothetical protein
MTVEDIGKLTIPQIEELFDGFAECNKDNNGGGSKSKDRLEDGEALRFLINNGGKL